MLPGGSWKLGDESQPTSGLDSNGDPFGIQAEEGHLPQLQPAWPQLEPKAEGNFVP